MKILNKLIIACVLSVCAFSVYAEQSNQRAAAQAAALGLTYIQPNVCNATSTVGDFLIRVSQVPGRNFITCDNHTVTKMTTNVIFDAGTTGNIPNSPWSIISPPSGQLPQTFVCRKTNLDDCGLFYSK